MRNRNLIFVLLVAAATMTFTGGVRADEISEAFERGDAAFHRGQYERAILEYREASTFHGPHTARAYFNVGVCQYKLGRAREAVSEYRTAIRMRQGKYPSASYALGIALQDLGLRQAANDAFLQAVAASGGKHAEALFEVALESHRNKDYDTAAQYYRRAITQSKDRIPACHNNLGVIFAVFGDLQEAVREFEVALKLSENKCAEASDNLERCRSLIAAPSPSFVATLRMSEAPSRTAINQ
jgi:tetratricopeptide (TPR) repeat protein